MVMPVDVTPILVSFDDNTNTGATVIDDGGSGGIYVDAKRKRMNRCRNPWAARYKARNIWDY